jgi:hypothetical protein
MIQSLSIIENGVLERKKSVRDFSKSFFACPLDFGELPTAD